MNTSKQIDISKSSIVGLKAELLRKQEEVKRLKELQQGNVNPEIIQKKKSVQLKSNEGIERRRAKDTDVTDVDYEAHKKSREVLEAKSRLYAKLKCDTVDEETKSKYLIDFDLKREIDKDSTSNTAEDEGTKHSENDEDYSDSNSDPENDWVDFVDTLGRCRRCLRKDLPEMRTKDAKLAATLRPPSPPPDTTPCPTPELLSWDMQREMMRKKWEEQETLLLGKKDIHYQDVRFDEARPHGVSYFEFSTDEAERARQQEELQTLRAQTEQQQEAAQGLRARRQQQLQARLAAARQRRRERLGLPPESPPHEAETPTTSNEGEVKKGIEEESITDLEDSVKKIAPIRPWDIGKNGLAPVMSQEEWIEKKRQERPEEFAPPSCVTDLKISADQKWKTNPNIFSSRRKNKKLLLSENEKLKKRHKKSKVEKGKEMGSQEEMQESEEGFGPSLKDWQTISQQTFKVSSENASNKISDISTQEFSKSRPTSSTGHTEESLNEDFPGPSVKGWKPTVTDIDLLLSKSRAGSLNTPLEETTLTETQESALHTDDTLKQKYTVSSDINTSMVKRWTYENTSVHSHNPKGAMKIGSEPSDKTESSETLMKPIVNLLEIDSGDEVEISSKKSGESKSNKWKNNKRKFAEIPPPPSMAYYIDADKKNTPFSSINPQLADSISAGIKYLKSLNEEKSKKRLRGMLDII